MPYNDTDLRILVTFSEEMVFGFIEEMVFGFIEENSIYKPVEIKNQIPFPRVFAKMRI